MRFKRSVGITADCFSEVFKMLLYRLVVGVIFFSLVYLILHFGLSFIVHSEELGELTGLIPQFFRALALSLAEGDAAALPDFQSAFHTAIADFLNLLAANMGSIIGSVIGVCCMYILQRIVNGLAQFAVAGTINDRMATYSHTKFAVSYFKNIGRAAVYYAVYVPLAFVYDVLSILACWFLFFYIPSLLPNWGVVGVLFTIVLTMTAVIALQALKLTVISGWMPAMLADGKPLIGAFRASVTAKDFTRRFGGFLIACYLIVFVNVGFGVFTAGSGLLITIPLSFLFLIAMQFVNYYETAGKKYFIEKNVVAGPDDDKPEQI